MITISSRLEWEAEGLEARGWQQAMEPRCVLRGCVPKKILVYGSQFGSEFEDAEGYGWKLEKPEFDWKKLIVGKTKEIERLNGIYKRILANAGVTLIEGEGKLLDAHTVQVTPPAGEVKYITAKHILIATGSRAAVLNIPGKEYGITSDEALSLEQFPKRVVVVGGGYIAVEFAGIFKGLGSEVHIMYRKELPLRGFDQEMRVIVAENLKARGIKVHAGLNPKRIEKTADGLVVTTDKGEKLVGDVVMFATGRKPNVRRLNLKAASIATDEVGAIVVNEYSQTNVPNIWAVGDVTNRINLTPVALMEGMAFAKTVFGRQPTKPDYQFVPSAVFCQPPMAVVGYTEDEAVAEGTGDIVVYTSSFTPMKNTISGRSEKTLMKLIVDSATDKVLGAAMCGPDAAEIMQGIAIAMKCGATKAQFDSTVGIHPSAAEEFVTMRTPTRRVAGRKKGANL
ncbi:hypothetical protein CBR_g21301 [Chara braunii]|uniref:Glutathione reductase n=1 Tax=Chara braunii TaxID=69332 RepID=A0A388L1A0_CHABU|nr:hypothetical protein CBR_g21301 [Chara braunii]|eukprot:GBG76061.1 hypothetical protein CBR_g21301 [Chara braunii]